MLVFGCPSVFSTEYIDIELPVVRCSHAPCKSGFPSGNRSTGPPFTSCGETYGFPFNSGSTGPRPPPRPPSSGAMAEQMPQFRVLIVEHSHLPVHGSGLSPTVNVGPSLFA